jgi:membrane-associated phospholipid phosphatase
MALIVRRFVFKVLWLAWPAWVSFTVMATGNHFWLDIAAGWLVAALGAAAVFGWRGVRRRRRLRAAPA